MPVPLLTPLVPLSIDYRPPAPLGMAPKQKKTKIKIRSFLQLRWNWGCQAEQSESGEDKYHLIVLMHGIKGVTMASNDRP